MYSGWDRASRLMNDKQLVWYKNDIQEQITRIFSFIKLKQSDAGSQVNSKELEV